MKPLQQLLNNLLSDHDNWKVKLLQEWPAILGGLSDKVLLEKVGDDYLILAVSDSCWLQELYLMSAAIRATINKKLDQPRIKTLRFKVMGRPSVYPTNKKSERKNRIRTTYPLSHQESQALACVQDEALKKALADFLQRCKQE